MISLLTMIVVMMIAFTSNVGQLVTEKIALQNTADFAAYSGAATQAGVLNEIRRHNQRIWQAHKTARQILETSENTPPPDFVTGGPCAVCAIGPYKCPQKKQNVSYEAAITAAKTVVSIKTPIIVGLNNSMGTRARGAAMQSVQQNYPGARMSPKGGSTEKADLKQDDIDLDYYGWGYVQAYKCPLNGQAIGSTQITHTTAKSWFFKNNNARGEVMFAVETSGTPATSFLGSDGGTYLGNYFGDRQELKAYAAALPIAGKVGTIKSGPRHFKTQTIRYNQ